jgi:hypothetical protein
LCITWARRQLAGLPRIERLADLAGMAYACLDSAERAELVSLLQAARQRVTREN